MMATPVDNSSQIITGIFTVSGILITLLITYLKENLFDIRKRKAEFALITTNKKLLIGEEYYKTYSVVAANYLKIILYYEKFKDEYTKSHIDYLMDDIQECIEENDTIKTKYENHSLVTAYYSVKTNINSTLNINLTIIQNEMEVKRFYFNEDRFNFENTDVQGLSELKNEFTEIIEKIIQINQEQFDVITNDLKIVEDEMKRIVNNNLT